MREPDSALDSSVVSIDTMDYSNELIEAATTGGKQQGKALQHISSLLDENQINLRQVKKDVREINQQLVIASHCKDALIFKSVIADIDDEHQLLNICINSPSSNVRNKIVEDIDDYNALKYLEKAFRQRDKSCHRKIKTKLDHIKSNQRKADEQEQSKIRLIEELTEHAQRDHNIDYRARFDSLQRKFEKLTQLFNREETESVEALLMQCANKIDREKPTQEELTPEQTPENQHGVSSSHELIASYCQLAETLLKPGFNPDKLLKTQEQLEDTFGQIDIFLPENDDEKELRNAIQSLAQAVDKYIFLLKEDQDFRKALMQIDDNTTDAAILQDSIRQVTRAKSSIVQNTVFQNHIGTSALCDLIADKQKQLKEIEEREKTQNRQIVGLIRKAHFAVKNGRLKQAQGIKRSIQDLIDEKQYLPSYLERQWNVLLEEVDELSDWHSYASLPKLKDLVSKMRLLAKTPLEPELQASRIKHLQEEWKLVAKGSAGKHQELWEEFKALADDAYQICERHYIELEKARAENTHHCEALIKQLEHYIQQYDWENANWRDVEKLLQSARNDWRKHKPILKLQQKNLTNQFNEKIDHVQAYLDAEYQKNKIEKVRLTSSLQSLISNGDLNQQDKLDNAIAIAIKYQKQWKNIGICRRSDEQALWLSFRKLCDIIFSQRDARRAHDREETDKIIRSAEGVIQQLKGIHSLSVDIFKSRINEVDSLKSQFESIVGIPEKIQKPLSKKFHKACQNIERRLKSMKEEDQIEQWQRLFTFKREINLANHQKDRHQFDQIKEEIETSRINASFTTALLSSLANAAPHADANTSKIDDKYYRLLCIKAEIHAGIDTPEADKELRMQHQVEQLQQHFGNYPTDPEQLALDWVQGCAIDPQTYDALVSRFISSWKKLTGLDLVLV